MQMDGCCIMEGMDGGWERRNGGLFLHPHRTMRQAAADPQPAPADDEDGDDDAQALAP